MKALARVSGWLVRSARGVVRLVINVWPRGGLGRTVALCLFLGWAVVVVTTVLHTAGIRTVYFWDQSGHWGMAIDYARAAFAWPRNALKLLYDSICLYDYTYVPHVLLAPCVRVLGPSKMVYSLSVLHLYLLPAVAVLSCFLFACLDRRQLSRGQTGALTLFVVLFPAWYTPVLGTSEPGGGGIVLVTTMLWSCLSDFYTRPRYGRSVVLALVTTALLLTRRWYAAWVVAFFMSLGVVTAWRCLLQRRDWRAICAFAVNMLIVGAVSLGILLICFRPFFVKTFFGSYVDTYSAFNKYGSLWGNLLALWGDFGWGYVGLGLLGTVLGLRSADRSLRNISAMLVLSLVVSSLLLCRFHYPHGGSRYVFAPGLVLLCCIGVAALIRRTASLRRQHVGVAVVVAFVLANWTFAFWPPCAHAPAAAKAVLSPERCYPSSRGDLEVLRELRDYLNARQRADGSSAAVYTVASSMTLNSDLLCKLEFPYSRQAIPGLLRTCDVDKRDGFPNQFFLADYVVVGRPVQLHLAPDGQTVVSSLAEDLLSATGLGAGYASEKSFTLDDGVTAIVYRKTAPCNLATARALAHAFEERYPGYPKLQVNALLPLTASFLLGERCGEIRPVEGGALFIHPGDTPTSLTLKPGGECRTLAFDATFDNLSALQANPERSGEIGLTLAADGKQVYRQVVRHTALVPVRVDLQGVDFLTITVDKHAFGTRRDWFLMRNIVLE